MDLGTFGAVMKFALQLEEDSHSFYESAIIGVSNDEIKTTFNSLMQRSEKRRELLERVRRENVTEMILEPISGLEISDYSIVTLCQSDLDDTKRCELAISIEVKRHRFYEDAGGKIEFLIEAADAFERLADENEENIDSLRNFL
ncbi:MAG: hypothetical protein RTU30_06075 [Candidatus Thorarchaeota archaeon]